jgi:hypothetical protein
MLKADQVELAIKQHGMSAVCAWCLKYWRARERDQKPGAWRCQATKPCGGPMQGMAFPEYEGPLEGNLASVCYVCGGEPDAMVEIHGRGMVGVCKERKRSDKTCMEILRDQLNNPRVVRRFEERRIPLFGDMN